MIEPQNTKNNAFTSEKTLLPNVISKIIDQQFAEHKTKGMVNRD
jgi:hypothetical protein